MDDVEAKLKKRLNEEESALLQLFLNNPASRIRDLIGKLMEEAEKG